MWFGAACARGALARCSALVLLPVLAVLASGCPIGPNYVRPAVPMPDEYRGQVQAVEAESIADLPWWDVFEDDVLQRLIREALEANYDLRAAVARVEQARALVGVARSPLFPQVGYQGQASRQKEPLVGAEDNETFNIFLGAFNLAWEIDVWGRIRRATEAAQAEMLATEEFRRGVLLTLVADVAQAYFELLQLDRELAIAHASVKTFTDTLELFTRRYVGGVGNKLQTSRAAAALAQAEASIPLYEQQIVAKENQIRVLLGADPGPIPRGKALVAQRMPPSTPPGIPAQILERRPDVLQAEAAIVSANAQVGVAIANFLPQIGLTSLIGGESSELKDIVKGSASIWALAGTISGPLFTGLRNYEQYRAQVALWEETKAQYEQTIVGALAEVSTTLVAQQKLVEQRAAEQRAVVALQESVDLSLFRYTAGLANYYEVLEAQQQLYPAQSALAQTQRDQLIAVVDLYLTLGGGWKLPSDKWVGPQVRTAQAPSRRRPPRK